LVKHTKEIDVDKFICLRGCLHADINIEIPKAYSFAHPSEVQPTFNEISVYCKLRYKNVLTYRTQCKQFTNRRLNKWLK